MHLGEAPFIATLLQWAPISPVGRWCTSFWTKTLPCPNQSVVWFSAHPLNLTRSQMYNFQLSFSLSSWFSPGPISPIPLHGCLALLPQPLSYSPYGSIVHLVNTHFSLWISQHIFIRYTHPLTTSLVVTLCYSRACICIFGYFYLFQFSNVVIALYSDTPSSPLNPFFFLSVFPYVQSSPTNLSTIYTSLNLIVRVSPQFSITSHNLTWSAFPLSPINEPR